MADRHWTSGAQLATRRGRWPRCSYALAVVVDSTLLGGCGGEVEEWVARGAASLGGNSSIGPFSSHSGGSADGGTSTFAGGGIGGVGGAGGSGPRVVVRCPAGNRVIVTGPTCGDGLIDPGEKCDDQNVSSGDGCSARCLIEPGWTCPSVGMPCLPCGNCRLDPGEACDDGNARNGDGCSDRCQLEQGFRCDIPLYSCVPTGSCGDDEVTVTGEVCDDGNVRNGDGCSADCKVVEPGFQCKIPGQPCERVSVTKPHCGDGVVQATDGETCDDGMNDGRYGGCSADCMIPVCGDGQVQAAFGETCDEGANNGASYLGCDTDCQYTLFPEPIDCTQLPAARCGDAQIQSEFGETCDDGINDGLNGRCATDCTSSRDGFCGDGFVNSVYEQCDDGNWNSCDGCSSRCQLETPS